GSKFLPGRVANLSSAMGAIGWSVQEGKAALWTGVEFCICHDKGPSPGPSKPMSFLSQVIGRIAEIEAINCYIRRTSRSVPSGEISVPRKSDSQDRSRAVDERLDSDTSVLARRKHLPQNIADDCDS